MVLCPSTAQVSVKLSRGIEKEQKQKTEPFWTNKCEQNNATTQKEHNSLTRLCDRGTLNLQQPYSFSHYLCCVVCFITISLTLQKMLKHLKHSGRSQVRLYLRYCNCMRSYWFEVGWNMPSGNVGHHKIVINWCSRNSAGTGWMRRLASRFISERLMQSHAMNGKHVEQKI